jgi:hypothetical protein
MRRRRLTVSTIGASCRCAGGNPDRDRRLDADPDRHDADPNHGRDFAKEIRNQRCGFSCTFRFLKKSV